MNLKGCMLINSTERFLKFEHKANNQNCIDHKHVSQVKSHQLILRHFVMNEDRGTSMLADLRASDVYQFLLHAHVTNHYTCNTSITCLGWFQIVLFLVTICAFCSVACLFWETSDGKKFQQFVPWFAVLPNRNDIQVAFIISILVFFSYAIVLNTVVPISLYVRWVTKTIFTNILVSVLS